jgi:hypothetical protein
VFDCCDLACVFGFVNSFCFIATFSALPNDSRLQALLYFHFLSRYACQYLVPAQRPLMLLASASLGWNVFHLYSVNSKIS